MQIEIEVNNMNEFEGAGNDNPTFLDFLKVYQEQLQINFSKDKLVQYLSELADT